MDIERAADILVEHGITYSWFVDGVLDPNWKGEDHDWRRLDDDERGRFLAIVEHMVRTALKGD